MGRLAIRPGRPSPNLPSISRSRLMAFSPGITTSLSLAARSKGRPWCQIFLQQDQNTESGPLNLQQPL